MKKFAVFINLILLFLIYPLTWVHGQQLFLSISGESSSFKSGDSRHQYDIWIKPEADAKRAYLQIYDAGINGDIDQITTTNANTITTFSLYHFDDLYTKYGNQIAIKTNSAPVLDTLIAHDENLYKKHWETLAEIKNESENGFIVRVTTNEGSDVNNYSLRVINDTGIQLNNDSWKIITVDLGIGIFNLPPKEVLQLKPYNAGLKLPELLVGGEEDSRVEIVDALGNTFPPDSTSGKSLQNKFGVENRWALNISGSKEILNNVTVYGKEQPQLWLYESAFTDIPNPEFEIISATASSCTDKTFRLNSTLLEQRQMQDAEWKINEDQTLANGFSPTISFSVRGSQTLNVLIPNPNPSVLPDYWVASTGINITTPPIARLETPKTVIAPGDTVTLSAEGSYDLSRQELSYTWFVDGRPSGKGPTFDFSSADGGNYIVSVRVSNAGEIAGCNNRQRQVRIRVNSQPYAEIEYDSTFHTGQYLTFSAVNANDMDDDSLSFLWDGLGVVSNDLSQREVIISHMATGTFEVSLTVNDNTNTSNSNYTVTKSYTVTPPPIAATRPVSRDTSETDTTADIQQGENPDTFTNGEASAPTPTPPPGLLTAIKPETSINAPQLTSDAKVNFSLGDSLRSPETADTTFYTWDFGDGTVSKEPNPSHEYQKPGTYAVNLTINKKGEITRKRHVIVINEYPTASFEIPDTLAAGHNFRVDGSVSTDNDGYIASYQWFIDGVLASTDAIPTLKIEEPGEHTVSLRVQDNSGHEKAQDLLSKNIWLNHAPVPKWDFSPEKIGPKDEVTLDASRSYDPDGEIKEIFWTFADGTILKGAKVTKSFEERGPKYFTLTLIDDMGLPNSTKETQGFININHPPYIITDKVVRSNSLNVELNASETYDVDNDQVFFEWILPDGTKRNEASFNWRAPDFGVHIISLTVNDGLGLSNSSNQQTIQVLINRPVEAVVDSLIETCSGQTVLFNSSRSYDPDGNNFNVKWYFGNGESSEEANPSYIYDAPGVYEALVELTDGISKEITTARIPVVVGGSPVARMKVSETTVCVNRPVKFDGSNSRDPSGALPSLIWELGDGTTESGPKVEHVYTEAGMYPVSLTVEGSGSEQCGNTNQIRTNIRVIEGPNVVFDIQEWATPGEVITLDGTASTSEDEITFAEWSIEYVPTGSIDTLNGMQTEYQFNEPGEYLVTLFLSTNSSTSCNSVSLTKSLKVNAAPIINWTLPEAVAAGIDLKPNALLSEDPDGFIEEFKWYLNGELIGKNASKIIKTVEPGNHNVILEVTDNSPSDNNRNRMEKSFFANSSPHPRIEAPGKVYINREVKLSGGPEFDRDGDRLSSYWKVNDQILSDSTFTPTEVKNYRITLVQDDGRNVSNSVDSAVVEIIPIGHPEIQPDFPSKISVGGSISISDLQIPQADTWKFNINGNYRNTWQAQLAGADSLQLTWFFEGRPTSTEIYPITVYEPLHFVNASDTLRTAEWNPANPTTVIVAPEVNRKVSEVKYTWLQNGEVIGSGNRINLPIEKGENRISVRIKDLYVAQSESIETELKVITEN